MKFSKIITPMVFFILALTWGITECSAGPVFYSTSDPLGHWFVSTNIDPTGDGKLSSFTTDNFIQAVQVTNRGDYIANNAAGTNGSIGTWTFFVFRQTFDLSGFDPSSANLQFQWGADDSGEGIADRGTWIPKFSLNGGEFVNYPGSPTPTYNYSSVVDLADGFVAGLNTIDFYVEGNGYTDGFELRTVSFTADVAPVPVPGAMLLLGSGLTGLIGMRRMKKA